MMEPASFPGRPQSKSQAVNTERTLAELEQEAILATLEAVDGNREAAARRLGVTSRTLRNKLKAWGE